MKLVGTALLNGKENDRAGFLPDRGAQERMTGSVFLFAPCEVVKLMVVFFSFFFILF